MHTHIRTHTSVNSKLELNIVKINIWHCGLKTLVICVLCWLPYELCHVTIILATHYLQGVLCLPPPDFILYPFHIPPKANPTPHILHQVGTWWICLTQPSLHPPQFLDLDSVSNTVCKPNLVIYGPIQASSARRTYCAQEQGPVFYLTSSHPYHIQLSGQTWTNTA